MSSDEYEQACHNGIIGMDRGEKSSIEPRRRPVNGLNGPMGKESQAPFAWAIAVGLSNLTLRQPDCN